MAAPRLLLLILLTMRLMVPPGICLCQLAGEAHHDGHDDGCPSSPLAAAMGLKPAAPEIDLPSAALDTPSGPLPFSSRPLPVARLAFPTAPPAYLSGCALLI